MIVSQMRKTSIYLKFRPRCTYTWRNTRQSRPTRGGFVVSKSLGKAVCDVTEKQKRFVAEYLIDLNATQAAIRAGYSPKTANEQGARLLANVSVQGGIAQAMAERSRRTGISQDRVVQELAKIAFVNASDVIDMEQATVLPGAVREDLACIQSVKVKDGNTMEREVKLADKLRALELLGRHLGMFKDKVEVSGLAEEQSKLSELLEQRRMRRDGT